MFEIEMSQIAQTPMSAFMAQHKIFIQFELLKQTGVKDLCFDMKFVAPKPGKRAI